MKKMTIWIIGAVMVLSCLGLLYMQMDYIDAIGRMRREHFDEGVKRRKRHHGAEQDGRQDAFVGLQCNIVDELGRKRGNMGNKPVGSRLYNTSGSCKLGSTETGTIL